MKVYTSKHYKLLLIVPVILLFISLYFSTQVEYGIDLRGGTSIIVPINQDVNIPQFKSKLESNFHLEDLSVRKVTGATKSVYVEFLGEKTLLQAQDLMKKGDYQQAVSLLKPTTGQLNVSNLPVKDQADNYFSVARQNFKSKLITFLSVNLHSPESQLNLQEIGPSLGNFFLKQSTTAIILAFVFIVLLIFYYFRTFVLSFAAAQSAFFDVLMAYAVLGAFHIPLSLATFAPLLMLIGYSIDTDIMLNDRMIKRKTGTKFGRLRGALKTGLTMTLTALFTMLSLLIVSYYANITVLFDISLMMVAGLLADIVATWFTNVVLVLWLMENRERRKK